MSAANALAAAKQSPWPGVRYREIAASLRSSQRRLNQFFSCFFFASFASWREHNKLATIKRLTKISDQALI
jgi:hypothetical protein